MIILLLITTHIMILIIVIIIMITITLLAAINLTKNNCFVTSSFIEGGFERGKKLKAMLSGL